MTPASALLFILCSNVGSDWFYLVKYINLRFLESHSGRYLMLRGNCQDIVGKDRSCFVLHPRVKCLTLPTQPCLECFCLNLNTFTSVTACI